MKRLQRLSSVPSCASSTPQKVERRPGLDARKSSTLQMGEDDHRMFPGVIMYSEGRVKPKLRGIFHALGVLLLLPAKGTLCSWGASTLFHCISWDIGTEIRMQKLDHSAVFINIACSYTSIAALVLRNLSLEGFYVVSFTTLVLWSLCLWGIWHVHYRRAQRMKLWISIIATTFPSYFVLSSQLTLDERAYTMLGLLCYGVGATIYGKRLVDPLPNTFGFHEIFHIFTVLATLCAFHLLWSLCQDLDVRCTAHPHGALFSFFRSLLANTISTFQDVCSTSGPSISNNSNSSSSNGFIH